MPAVLEVTVSWWLAGVLAIALHHKLTAWQRFRAAFIAYRLWPERWASVGAATLAVVEGACVLGLLLLQRWALALAGLLLAVYGMAMFVNMLRGRAFIDCGCGDEPMRLSGGLLLRNTLLAASALSAYLFGNVIGVRGVDLVVGAGLSLAALLVYAIVEQLFANRSIHARLWLGSS